ncbi:MAG: DUF447 domain-containing protein [Planctomycetaceae bacterium]
MILEGLVTTRDAEGRVNLAPMGPIVDESMTTLLLRPFQTSRTFQNLKARPQGVFHVVDDALLLAQAAIDRIDPFPEMILAETIDGEVLKSACRWYEFRIESIDERNDRAELIARVVHCGRLRDFFGFNRAKHAVVEAAILATRVHLIPRDELFQSLEALRPAVVKTGGERELAAFALLEKYVRESCRAE